MKLDLLQMKWSLSLVLTVVTLPDSFSTETSNKYVTPSGEVTCNSEQSPCLSLDVYASEPADVHFTNNSVFYFLPGSHRMNGSLRLVNVQKLVL